GVKDHRGLGLTRRPLRLLLRTEKRRGLLIGLVPGAGFLLDQGNQAGLFVALDLRDVRGLLTERNRDRALLVRHREFLGLHAIALSGILYRLNRVFLRLDLLDQCRVAILHGQKVRADRAHLLLVSVLGSLEEFDNLFLLVGEVGVCLVQYAQALDILLRDGLGRIESGAQVVNGLAAFLDGIRRTRGHVEELLILEGIQ